MPGHPQDSQQVLSVPAGGGPLQPNCRSRPGLWQSSPQVLSAPAAEPRPEPSRGRGPAGAPAPAPRWSHAAAEPHLPAGGGDGRGASALSAAATPEAPLSPSAPSAGPPTDGAGGSRAGAPVALQPGGLAREVLRVSGGGPGHLRGRRPPSPAAAGCSQPGSGDRIGGECGQDEHGARWHGGTGEGCREGMPPDATQTFADLLRQQVEAAKHIIVLNERIAKSCLQLCESASGQAFCLREQGRSDSTTSSFQQSGHRQRAGVATGMPARPRQWPGPPVDSGLCGSTDARGGGALRGHSPDATRREGASPCGAATAAAAAGATSPAPLRSPALAGEALAEAGCPELELMGGPCESHAGGQLQAAAPAALPWAGPRLRAPSPADGAATQLRSGSELWRHVSRTVSTGSAASEGAPAPHHGPATRGAASREGGRESPATAVPGGPLAAERLPPAAAGAARPAPPGGGPCSGSAAAREPLLSGGRSAEHARAHAGIRTVGDASVAVSRLRRGGALASLERKRLCDSAARKRQKIEDLASWEGRMYKDSGCCAEVARNSRFRSLAMVAVLLSTLWLGVETNYAKGADESAVCQVINRIFCAFFLFEIAVRIGALKQKRVFFQSPSFLLDIFLVLVMISGSLGCRLFSLPFCTRVVAQQHLDSGVSCFLFAYFASCGSCVSPALASCGRPCPSS
ncbi:unnamed protein product [Prorocentrum cordatum]|uniref:Ion transport domain-containing protein n=1 Tax=Prorocentrum cordatum TaxID=2364126 RepID=A0ABN9UPN0_9DINO|nr:unnamed protein product [Polarella glacialis]